MAAGLLAAATTEIAIITYRDLKQINILPLPSDYAAVAIIYGGLALLPDSAKGLAAAVGWGLVVATLVNLWNPASPVGAPTLRQSIPAPQGAPTP